MYLQVVFMGISKMCVLIFKTKIKNLFLNMYFKFFVFFGNFYFFFFL